MLHILGSFRQCLVTSSSDSDKTALVTLLSPNGGSEALAVSVGEVLNEAVAEAYPTVDVTFENIARFGWLEY